MTKLLYLVLLGQLLISCLNMNDPESQAAYIEGRSKFDKSLLTLFPDRLPNTMTGFGFTAPHENIPGGLHLMTNYFSEKEYLKIKTQYVNRSKSHKRSIDKCLFLVDDHEGMNQEKCEEFYPTATRAVFDPRYDRIQRKRIVDSEVYFIDSKPGDVMKDGKNHSRANLPEQWTHGYSTGITTNDNNRTILIWLVVW